MYKVNLNRLNKYDKETLEGIKYHQEYKKQQVALINHLGLNMYRNLKKHNAIIAGGMITSLFTGNEINDVDLYFKNESDAIKLLSSLRPFISHVSEKAISFELEGVSYQIIKLGENTSVVDIFNRFDFTVCMGAFNFENEKFYLHNKFLVHNINKELAFNKNTLFPLISALRVHKYLKKGYSISNSELIKIMLKISELNITSFEELQHHLGGMYGEDISELKNEEDKSFNISDVIEKLSQQKDYIPKKAIVKNSNYLQVEYVIEEYVKEVGDIMESNHIIFAEVEGSYYGLESYPHNLEECIPVNKEIVVYKYVEKTSLNKLVSIFRNSFEYKLNQIIKDELNGLYFNTKEELSKSSYNNKKESDNIVILVCKVNLKDLKKITNNALVFTQCTPLEVLEGVDKTEFLNNLK